MIFIASSAQFVAAMKKTAMEAVEQSRPMQIIFGTVKSRKPLEIMVNQKLVIKEESLVLTHAVKDYEVDIEVSHYTVNDDFLKTRHDHPDALPNEFDSHHKHAYKGRKKIKIYNGLKVGEEVILAQAQGGQKYVILDRMKDPKTEGEWV